MRSIRESETVSPGYAEKPRASYVGAKSKKSCRQRTFAPSHFHGFSLTEVLVSVAIITVLMSAVFQFMSFNQRRYRGDQLLAERNAGARGALELLTQEVQQAGQNVNFSPNKTLTADANPTGTIVNVSVNNTTGIFYGNFVEIGSMDSTTDPNREIVTVTGDATHTITATTFPAIITMTHKSGAPVFSRSQPFPTGVWYNSGAITSSITPVDVNLIQIYGDLDGNGTLRYAEYKLVASSQTTDLQCVSSLGPPVVQVICNMYQLQRYTTQIMNPNIPVSKAATSDSFSPLADNILGYPDSGGVIRNPDGVKPIFRLNYETYGDLTLGAVTYVRSVDVDITLQTVNRDPEVNEYRTIRMRSHLVPTNIGSAWGITLLGGTDDLPVTPKDLSGHTLPIPDT